MPSEITTQTPHNLDEISDLTQQSVKTISYFDK